MPRAARVGVAVVIQPVEAAQLVGVADFVPAEPPRTELLTLPWTTRPFADLHEGDGDGSRGGWTCTRHRFLSVAASR